MVSKKVLLFYFLFLISYFCTFAQEVNYRIDVRYIQRLTWVDDEYAMRYEVIIEKYENRRYISFFKDFTENDFIEVSLPPGNYRYQVIPYDYLNSPINVTDWTEFQVLRAPDNEERTFTPMPVTVEKFDFFISASWEPFFPVYNATLFSGENTSLIGAHLRFGTVISGQFYLNPGLEFGVSWKMFKDDTLEEMQTQLFTATLNFLGQIRFPKGRGAVNFRAGFGVSLISDTENDSIPRFDTFHVNLGISFLFLVTRNLYLEAGADIPQFISIDHHGYLFPWIGIGVRF